VAALQRSKRHELDEDDDLTQFLNFSLVLSKKSEKLFRPGTPSDHTHFSFHGQKYCCY